MRCKKKKESMDNYRQEDRKAGSYTMLHGVHHVLKNNEFFLGGRCVEVEYCLLFELNAKVRFGVSMGNVLEVTLKPFFLPHCFQICSN